MMEKAATQKDLQLATSQIEAKIGKELATAATDRKRIETKLDSKIDHLRKDVDGLRKDVDGLRKDVDGLRKDVNIIAHQVGHLTNQMASIKSELTDEIGKAAAHIVKVIEELVANNVTMIDEKYDHIPRKVNTLQTNFEAHCKNALAHS